ncbi:MAG: MotA/TolQ/ExbB proton channel family protein [Planctomycetota bacterium]|nr:MotA/TolQ/ExbB proton channel family protein [Planctomycetota bacterium]
MINTLAVLFNSNLAVELNPMRELPFVLNRIDLIVPRLQQLLPLAQTSTDESNISSTEAQRDGILDIVLSGGPIGVVIVLILIGLSVSTAYLLFDQLMTLRRKELLPDGIADSVRQALLTGRVSEADAACRRSPSVLSVVLLSGLSEIDLGWREVEKAVEDSLTQQASRLMRKIEYLSVIGNISPMVGLLGTVTGMIFAFQQVATTRGAAGAGDLAEGIYQALVTTVGGLVVAIPSLAIYAVCRNRVDTMIAEIAYQSQVALAPVKRRPTRTTRPNPAGQVVGTAKVTASKTNAAATSQESRQESPRQSPKSPPLGSGE